MISFLVSSSLPFLAPSLTLAPHPHPLLPSLLPLVAHPSGLPQMSSSSHCVCLSKAPWGCPHWKAETKSAFYRVSQAQWERGSFEEPAKEGKGLALKMLLQFADSWDLASPRNSAVGKKAPGQASLLGTPALFIKPHVTPVRELAAESGEWRLLVRAAPLTAAHTSRHTPQTAK